MELRRCSGVAAQRRRGCVCGEVAATAVVRQRLRWCTYVLVVPLQVCILDPLSLTVTLQQYFLWPRPQACCHPFPLTYSYLDIQMKA